MTAVFRIHFGVWQFGNNRGGSTRQDRSFLVIIVGNNGLLPGMRDDADTSGGIEPKRLFPDDDALGVHVYAACQHALMPCAILLLV